MSNTTESRPSWTGRPSRPSRTSAPNAARPSRQAIVSPPPTNAAQPSNIAHKQSRELIDQLESLVDHVKSTKDGEKETLIDNVKRIAKSMQQKVAKLGGIASPRTHSEEKDETMRASRPDGRPSLSSSLDGYHPDRDIVAPISVRPNAMELLWVCGDCGAHYSRQMQPPENCGHCGAPRQNFYAPIED